MDNLSTSRTDTKSGVPAAKPKTKGKLGSDGGPRIGLAFGGGGAKGFAHVHAIKAFDDIGLRPAQITGASIGSIMGAGMASGMSGEEIEEHSLKAFGQSTEIISRIWNMRPKALNEVFGRENRFGQLNGQRVLESFLPDTMPKNIEELAIPFSAIATDFFSMEERFLDRGNLLEALAASSAIPGVFQATPIDGRYCIDGGTTNCLPFDRLNDDLDITIAIDVAGEVANVQTDRPPTAIEALMGSNLIMIRKMRELRLRHRHPDILIQAPVNAFAVQDFLRVATILETTADLQKVLRTQLDRMIKRKLQGKEWEPTMLLVEPRALAG
ncbi:MAG: patatin-like phospholipase family protein [Pseudomonadota bacterium]